MGVVIGFPSMSGGVGVALGFPSRGRLGEGSRWDPRGEGSSSGSRGSISSLFLAACSPEATCRSGAGLAERSPSSDDDSAASDSIQSRDRTR